MKNNSLKNIPSIHILLEYFQDNSEIERKYLKKIIQNSIDEIKVKVLSGAMIIDDAAVEIPPKIENYILCNIKEYESFSLKKVINATGVILHTGLGRAPFSKAVRENMNNVVEDYCNLELDLKTGKRGERLLHVNKLLQLITGAEAGLIVNNNAAAVLLLLNTFGKNKEVILSRGELVEIGGSFRMPEVMEVSGTILKEIGATNKTHPADYVDAISKETSMILKVHPSNFRIAGFSKEVSIPELQKIAAKNNVLLTYDLGGGALFNLKEVNLPEEPVVSDLIEQGVDIITFSGDKLIGGPQCGIIVGKEELIKKMHQNPMYRALRVDKNTLSLLEASLKTIIAKKIHGNELYDKISKTEKQLRQTANSILKELKNVKKYFQIVNSPVQIWRNILRARLLKNLPLILNHPLL